MIQEKGITELCILITDSSSIARLNLRENILKDEVIRVLAKALKYNKSIVELNISQCSIAPKGFEELFCELQFNESISCLIFGNQGNTNRNRIGDLGSK